MNPMWLSLSLIVLALPTVAHADAARILSEGQRELKEMKSSHYQHKTSVDESSGRFDYDCSGFLDYALARIDPGALAELPISKPKGKRPLAQDYFNLLAGSPSAGSHWARVSRAADLAPGDVIAWLIPPTSKSKDTGHVMIVVEPAKLNAADSRQVLVKVMDSAASAHASDSRGKGQSGLGTGTIAILNDADSSKAVGFYWRANESKAAHLTKIVFGRVVK